MSINLTTYYIMKKTTVRSRYYSQTLYQHNNSLGCFLTKPSTSLDSKGGGESGELNPSWNHQMSC